MLLAVDYVFVNRGVEGLLDLAGGAGEFRYGTALGGAHLESLRLQPCSNGLNVAVGWSELLAELFRRQPFVVAG